MTDAPRHASDSFEQRQAEKLLVAQFSIEIGRPLAPQTIRLDDGSRVDLDAATTELGLLVEAWAHIGPAKPAQVKKVLTDALKLQWVASRLPTRPARLVLLFADTAAAAPFTPTARGWGARAIADGNVDVVVCDIGRDMRETISAAQLRQFR
jgi:hypothetical protein